MADQRLAMTWVQRHIEAFGGDGHAVTIFGESAGGNSILNHLAQPASFDLYARAISESGTYDVGAHSMAESEAGYRAVLALSNCSSLACLKGLDSDNVSALHHAMLFDGPTIDGVSLTDTPAALFAKGDYNTKAPVIIGSNRDESAFFTRIERVPPSMNESLFDFSLQHGSPIERAGRAIQSDQKRRGQPAQDTARRRCPRREKIHPENWQGLVMWVGWRAFFRRDTLSFGLACGRAACLTCAKYSPRIYRWLSQRAQRGPHARAPRTATPSATATATPT